MISLSISVIIPALNSGRVLEECLRSITSQDFNGKIEIIIVDGGSTDNTLAIAKKYKCVILNNPLVTAEAAKAIGVKNSKYDLVALIDSDNILPNSHWFTDMILPLTEDKNIVGCEPISFTYRPGSGFIERYSALLGANDPYAYFTGTYDRYSFLSKKWTDVNIKTSEFKTYTKLFLTPNHPIPTIGANGTIFRKNFLIEYLHSDYLFDIDIIAQALNTNRKSLYFAKVHTGITHTFCESSVSKFIKKQQRRVHDLYYYRNYRQFPWTYSAFSRHNFLFGLYSLSIFLPIYDSIRGFLNKPDVAWFFHPMACFITIFIYASGYFKNMLRLNTKFNRSSWSQ